MEYPRMLYHPIEGQTIVENEKTCHEHLDRGWSKLPVPPDEAEIIKARIKEYESELKQMRRNLASLGGKEAPGADDALDSKIDAVVAENERLTARVVDLL